VSFYTDRNNVFYLELAIDRTEFIKLNDFQPDEEPDLDALIDEANAKPVSKPTPPPSDPNDYDDLLKSLGM
jgi:hypothetical protein